MKTRTLANVLGPVALVFGAACGTSAAAIEGEGGAGGLDGWGSTSTGGTSTGQGGQGGQGGTSTGQGGQGGTSTGQGGQGGTSTGQGGQGGTSTEQGGQGGTSTTTSTTSECTVGEHQCDGGQRYLCTGTGLVLDPCGANEGCDEATGTCSPCVCTPGASTTCSDATTRAVCDTDCMKEIDVACTGDQVCSGGACEDPFCTPGATACLDSTTVGVCNAQGSAYEGGPPCGSKETCTNGQCISLCEAAASAKSSVGCSFFGLNMFNFNETNPDAIAIGNTNSTETAMVSLYTSQNGQPEQLIQGPIAIAPNALHTFTLPNGSIDIINGSALRTGGAFRVESDVPVIAYQHSPLQPQATNDASCLLPESTLGTQYIVASYVDALGSYPSYFNVIATEPNTEVKVTVPVATSGGPGVPNLSAGQSQTFTMNRYDTLQIAAPGSDVTGTVISASAPVSVIGAVQCAQVPAGATYCDHIEEQMLPVRNWGKTYVGARAPKRSGTERFYWRVLASQDGTTIETNPPQAGFPKTLDAAKFYEFWTQEDLVFTGDQPFMAFQYISGQNAFGAGTGDPAMVTAVPVEQFLNHYVLLTPSGYSNDYVQVIRTGGSQVMIDGSAIPDASFRTVGNFQVADHPVGAGVHALESATPFGIVGVGYTGVTSYGYPGGMALINLNP